MDNKDITTYSGRKSKPIYHPQYTDIAKSDSVQNTINEIQEVFRDINGCVPTPDIVVNSAGRLPKACLTTALPVS